MTLFNQFRQQSQSKPLKEEDLIQLHHDMMCCYGWISFEEFKALPIPTFWNLVRLSQEEKRKREELRLCTLKFYGVKNPK